MKRNESLSSIRKIANGLEAIATRLLAIAIRLLGWTIARMEAIISHLAARHGASLSPGPHDAARVHPPSARYLRPPKSEGKVRLFQTLRLFLPFFLNKAERRKGIYGISDKISWAFTKYIG